MLTIFGLLIVTALVAILLPGSTSEAKQKKAARLFLELVQKKDPENSYLMTSKRFGEATSIEDWTNTVNKVSSYVAGDFEDDKENGAGGVYSYAPEGSDYVVTIGVEREDGKEKIYYFNSTIIANATPPVGN